MAIQIGDVTSIQTRSGEIRPGFTLKDSTAPRFMSITYPTPTEAKAAREQILAATANADAEIG